MLKCWLLNDKRKELRRTKKSALKNHGLFLKAGLEVLSEKSGEKVRGYLEKSAAQFVKFGPVETPPKLI